MAVTPFKTFVAGEVLTASDLNSTVLQITDNGEDLGWPATKAKDLDGQELVLDADGDSSFTADTDDQLDLKIGGTDQYVFKASSFDVNAAEIILDADADTSVTSDTDDQIDFRLQGQDLFVMDGTTASAVNGLTWTASDTGNAVDIGASGSDSNIPITITPKGSGTLTLDGAVVGGGTSSDLPLISEILGKQTIWVPAASMTPTTTSGCASLAQVELTSLRPEPRTLDFDGTAREYCQWEIVFPKSWNEGALQARVYWTTSATDTDAVVWEISAISCNDGDQIDAVAYSGGVNVTDAAQSAANLVLVTDFDSVTPQNATAAAITYFRLRRDPTSGSDTMAEDAKLLGVEITWTNDALNDD